MRGTCCVWVRAPQYHSPTPQGRTTLSQVVCISLTQQ